jgi:hypothetical protein
MDRRRVERVAGVVLVVVLLLFLVVAMPHGSGGMRWG